MVVFKVGLIVVGVGIGFSPNEGLQLSCGHTIPPGDAVGIGFSPNEGLQLTPKPWLTVVPL